MTDYIIKETRDIPKDRLSSMHQGEEGTAGLEIKLYYYKDARPRGLKLSVSRCLIGGGFRSYDLMNAHNGRIHVADFARKPSPKVAAEWEATVRAKLDEIAEIALASDTPDWRAVRDLFSFISA